MRANVKPLTYWLIHKGYSVRFGRRTPHSVKGVITTPDGELEFDYDPGELVIRLPQETVRINQFGWETDNRGAVHTDDPVDGHEEDYDQ